MISELNTKIAAMTNVPENVSEDILDLEKELQVSAEVSTYSKNMVAFWMDSRNQTSYNKYSVLI